MADSDFTEPPSSSDSLLSASAPPSSFSAPSSLETQSPSTYYYDPDSPEEPDLREIVNPTRSFLYILLLTVIIGGLQLSWCVELSNGTPFLLSLGMSKSLMSLVWIAGPLSGTVGQPVVGVWSDNLRWSWGRRRPFIIGGAIATITSLLILCWSKTIVSWVTGGGTDEQVSARTIPFAVLFVYILDFSISAIQAGARVFIVDNVPTHQQQFANAWAARMIGIGNIIGYFLGSLNLPSMVPFFGNTQFRAFSMCACIVLLITLIPVALIRERDPNTDPMVLNKSNDSSSKPPKSQLKQIYFNTITAIRNLSPQTKLACNIEFFAWIGYFPMLFYTTSYVGDMYKRQITGSRDPSLPPMTAPELDDLAEQATRVGSQALVLFAITSLAGNILLPHLVQDSYEDPGSAKKTHSSSWLERLRIPGLTIGRMWMISHLVFVFAMVLTFFVSSVAGSMAVIGILGIPWALALWAPFAIISEEVSRITVKKAQDSFVAPERPKLYHNYEHEAGIILGVHNVFVALPQVVSSLMSSLLFKILSGSTGDSIVWVFRFGGIGALIAAYLSTKIKSPEQVHHEEEAEQSYSRTRGRS